MLIVTRRLNECVFVYPQDLESDPQEVINIKFLGINYNSQSIRLGIHAPQEYKIHREEVYRRIMTNERGILLCDQYA